MLSLVGKFEYSKSTRYKELKFYFPYLVINLIMVIAHAIRGDNMVYYTALFGFSSIMFVLIGTYFKLSSEQGFVKTILTYAFIVFLLLCLGLK